jgi:hypothetical protein
MKNSINFKSAIFFTLIVTGIAILQSCVVYRPNTSQLVSVTDIVQMSKDGLSSKDIIGEIRHSHTVYSLKADQLVKLRDEGVQDSVLNYMEETKIDAVRQNQRYADSAYWYMAPDGFFYGGFGWGWPYGYYGWNTGPVIVYNVNRGYGGGYHGGYHGGGAGHSGGRR